MYETVTTATKRYSTDDPLFNLTNRNQTTDTIGWTTTHDSDSEVLIEDWNLSATDDSPTSHFKLIRIPKMSENADSNNMWLLNGKGQLVNAETAGWELADEIVRLKIGDVVGEGEDGSIRTPSKSKMAPTAVPQLSESSPHDTASSLNSSPQTPEHQITISHSRGSSTDTTVSSSQESVSSAAGAGGNPILHSSFKNGSVNEVKERPHSFSGGLSSADLRRLQQAGDPEMEGQLQQQQQQWASSPYRDEQPSYPSLSNTVHRPQPPVHAQLYDYRSGQPGNNPTRDDLVQQIDFNVQQRAFGSMPQAGNGQAAPAFVPGPGRANVPQPLYRQAPPRPFPQQNVIPSPTALGYPGAPPHHGGHMSLGNSQQIYDMMLPAIPHENINPAVNRVQQQHNVFPRAHHHSSSDPSALRDAATLALMNGNMQAYNPAMYPGAVPAGMQLYPNQFYRTQDAYARPDPAAQAMAARLQAQYTGGPYGMVSPQMDQGLASPTSTNGGQGPSANNRKLGLYKTELCRSWEEKGSCRYGAKCQFAHGEEELRNVARHPKYKTEICRTFWVSGSCPYGKRCCFIHTELPTSGGAGGASGTGSDVAPPPARSDGRARSLSTNSDPNDASVSLLARISAKRSQESTTNSSNTPIDSPSSFQFTRPPTGSLRVDTSTLDGPIKQNKSAYPTFASNGILMAAPERIKAKSPAPVTAGPDLGRHNNSRLEIVGYNQRSNAKATTPPSNASSNPRNSIGGSEDLNFIPSPVTAGPVSSGHSYTLSSGDGNSGGRANGHVRAGSAGNWGNFTRGNYGSPSYPSPSAEATINSPWSTTELAVGTSRFTDKAWS
ncbi:hypothetical protein C8J56DRAFT_293845 [Mycena floridula]|nr:hypothetical protein C8J56DRAFT_293845 [Mycena floridula]